MKRTCKLLVFLLPALLASCVTQINGSIRTGGTAEMTLDTNMGPRTAALINSFRLFSGEPASVPILDGPAISRSLSIAPGVRAVSFRNTSAVAMDGNISISSIGDFLTLPNAGSRFITFTEGNRSSSIIVNLDRESATQIISLLSPEIHGYLSALMAPVVLGETMTATEYLNLVTSIYSRPLANEIAESHIIVTVEFSRPVTAIHGGTFSGNKAEFDLPLLDILLLERPMRYEASW